MLLSKTSKSNYVIMIIIMKCIILLIDRALSFNLLNGLTHVFATRMLTHYKQTGLECDRSITRG